MVGVHNLHRKENADLEKIYKHMDPKRQKRYMQMLKDALPKDINAVEMCHLECKAVTKEWMDDVGLADGDLEAAAAAAPAADADPAAAGELGDAHDGD